MQISVSNKMYGIGLVCCCLCLLWIATDRASAADNSTATDTIVVDCTELVAQ